MMEAEVRQSDVPAVLDNGKPITAPVLLRLADKLIPVPRVIQRALIMLRSGASLHRIGQALGTDPSVAATLLRLANSSFYRGAQECRDVPSAVVRIGAHRLKEVLLAMAVMRPARPEPALAAKLRRLMMVHSAAARVVGLYLDDVDADTAFLSGLFCDVGQLLLALAANKTYEPLHEQHRANQHRLADAERTWAGFDHAALGSQLLARWEVPAAVISVVEGHHSLAALMMADEREVLLAAAVTALAGEVAAALSGLAPPESISADGLRDHESMVFLGLDDEILDGLYEECKQAAFELGAVFGR